VISAQILRFLYVSYSFLLNTCNAFITISIVNLFLNRFKPSWSRCDERYSDGCRAESKSRKWKNLPDYHVMPLITS